MIDQRTGESPLVQSTDSMIIKVQEDDKKFDADKPFCCIHRDSENYIKYGKKKQ